MNATLDTEICPKAVEKPNEERKEVFIMALDRSGSMKGGAFNFLKEGAL